MPAPSLSEDIKGSGIFLHYYHHVTRELLIFRLSTILTEHPLSQVKACHREVQRLPYKMYLHCAHTIVD